MTSVTNTTDSGDWAERQGLVVPPHVQHAMADKGSSYTPSADTTDTPGDTRAEYTAGLRELADWIDAHPDLPLPYSLTDQTFPIPGVHGQMGFAERDECERGAAKLGVKLAMHAGGQYRGEYQHGRINLTLVWFTPAARAELRAAS